MDTETRQHKAEERRKWREEESRKVEDAKRELAEECGLERGSKFNMAWDIAWERGHAEGLHEVKDLFRELAELISPENNG